MLGSNLIPGFLLSSIKSTLLLNCRAETATRGLASHPRLPAARRRTPDGGGRRDPAADTAPQLSGGGHRTDLADLLREPLVLVPDQPGTEAEAR